MLSIPYLPKMGMDINASRHKKYGSREKRED